MTLLKQVHLLLILSFLVTFIKKILEKKEYPHEWTCGIVTPISKSREVGDPENYREITINSCLSKFLNLPLNNRLTYY